MYHVNYIERPFPQVDIFLSQLWNKVFVGFVFFTCTCCFEHQGPIPESLSLLRNLEELWLNGNRLSGIIPEGLGRLHHLRELYLNANELVGGIPSSFGGLASLEGLNLGWNQLSGGFPASLGNMVRIIPPRSVLMLVSFFLFCSFISFKSRALGYWTRCATRASPSRLSIRVPQ